MAKGKHRRGKPSHQHAKQLPRPRRQPPRQTKGQSRYGWTSNNGAKIEEYMTSHGVVRKPIIGDGNCLFRAMADQIGYGEHRHTEIREKVVETIRADKEYFANFIDEDEVEGVDAYCDEMIKDGVWGDDIELEAFRRAFGRAIVIYDASTGTPYVKPWEGDEGTSLNTVHLWKSENHYESVRNKDGPYEGRSMVVYKDVKMAPEDVERIKKEHEDNAVKELSTALPHINVDELRRLLREHGDGNKVLELISEQQAQEPEREIPNGISTEDTQDRQQEALSASIDMLSLDTLPPSSEDTETQPPKDETPNPPSSTEDIHDPKYKARQRRQVSTARKEKQAKRAQKEAAKRRKRMEAMGIGQPEYQEQNITQEHVLKAIVI